MNAAEHQRIDLVPSPCISMCTMNPATDLCEGCLRTIGEISAWTLLDADDKRAVLARIAARRRALASPTAATA
jgi:predicted Fe-S protein YdhL (DUF1289 family)